MCDVCFRSTSLVSLQNCTNISCLRILCVVGRLDRGQSAVVKVRSRLWARTFLQVGVFTRHLDIFHDLSVTALLDDLFPPQVYYLLSEFVNVFLALFTLKLDYRFVILIQRLFFSVKQTNLRVKVCSRSRFGVLKETWPECVTFKPT